MDPISGWTSPQYGDLIPTPTVWYRTQPSGAPVTFVTLLYPFRDQPVNVSLRVRVGSGPAEIQVDANGRSRILALDFAEGTTVRSVK
jgi:hypothetical protein